MKRIIRLTENDLSSIVKRVINEQQTNFCDNAVYDKQNYQNNFNNINGMIDQLKKLQSMDFDCELDKFMVFDITMRNIFEKYGNLLEPRFPTGINQSEYLNHLKQKYNI